MAGNRRVLQLPSSHDLDVMADSSGWYGDITVETSESLCLAMSGRWPTSPQNVARRRRKRRRRWTTTANRWSCRRESIVTRMVRYTGCNWRCRRRSSNSSDATEHWSRGRVGPATVCTSAFWCLLRRWWAGQSDRPDHLTWLAGRATLECRQTLETLDLRCYAKSRWS